jgi:hypothetical protein
MPLIISYLLRRAPVSVITAMQSSPGEAEGAMAVAKDLDLRDDLLLSGVITDCSHTRLQRDSNP